jgi:hypothetical protein
MHLLALMSAPAKKLQCLYGFSFIRHNRRTLLCVNTCANAPFFNENALVSPEQRLRMNRMMQAISNADIVARMISF